MNKYEELEKLQHLKESGALTDEEFEKEKKIILGHTSQNTTDKVNKQQEKEETTGEQGKVIIHSYEEVFAVNPDVKVYIDGNLTTSLSKGQTYEYPISKTTTITFKSSIRKAKVTVSPNAITEIRLIWNRATGSLKTICNEQNFNGVNNSINQQAYQSKLNSKKKADKIWIVIGVILGLIALIWCFKDGFEGWKKADVWIGKEQSTQNQTSNQTNKTSTVKPLDKTQDIVYTLPNKPYPIINLNSSDVNSINIDIEQNYIEPNEPYVFGSEYDYYLNNEILSLVISNHFDSAVNTYDVYNININTGKVVSNEEILKSKNISEKTFLSKLPEYYEKKFSEEWR